MQASLFLAAVVHLAIIVALAVLLTRRCVDSYAHPGQLLTTERPGSVSLPVVTICPDQPLPARLPRAPTCLFSLTQAATTNPIACTAHREHILCTALRDSAHTSTPHPALQGLNQQPQPVNIRPVATKIRAPTGHESEYSCYECNADRSSPLPATGISQVLVAVMSQCARGYCARSAALHDSGSTLCILSQLFVEVNRSGSGSAFAPNLVAYTGGAVQAALPTDQQQWVRLYQQESTIHQLTARKTQRLSGAVDAGFDVAPKSLPCSQVPPARHHRTGRAVHTAHTPPRVGLHRAPPARRHPNPLSTQAMHQHGASCAGLSVLMVRYAHLDVAFSREVPALDVVVALCALAGAASCLLVSLRGFARLLTGARGMPTEAETLHLIAGSKPPPVFTDPHTGRQMAHTVAWSASAC